MVIKREVAYGIVQGLSEFWNCEELQDFTVTVGETNFGCHKLLLAACSGFFRGLFRSGMKETQQNCVTLEEISGETFQFILEAIYTGQGILTADNVIDIWRAAHQLQITFMITECEMFVITSLSLENYIQYFHYGRIFSSEKVTKTVWNFFLRNSNSFFNTSYFLELPFEDVLTLIKSQDLATSTEDEVLKAIIKWAEYTPDKELQLQNNANSLQAIHTNIHTMSTDIKRIKGSDTNSQDPSAGSSKAMSLKDNTSLNNNTVSCNKSVPCDESVSGNKTGLCEGTPLEPDNRKQYLFELVSNTRTCLASHGCLEMLLSHPLISETKQVRDVINKAIMYQLQAGQTSGQWPTGATHRNKSEFENVAVTFKRNSKLMVYSFLKHNWSEYKSIAPFYNEMVIQMVAIGTSLYFLCVRYDEDDLCYDCPCLVYRLSDSRQWSSINISLEILNTAFSAVAVNGCIYIAQVNKFWKLNPTLASVASLSDLPDKEPISHLTYYDTNIFAFYCVCAGNGLCKTAVQSFDISNNSWARLNTLEGPASGLISFKDDQSLYLLQSVGDLWKLVKPQSGAIDFELVAKLWHCFWPLHGAVIFLNELYIYGTKSENFTDDPLQLKCITGLFKKIHYLQSPEVWSINAMFVPFIAERSCQ